MAKVIIEPEVSEIPKPDMDHLVMEDDTPVDNIFSEKHQRLLTESLYTSLSGEGVSTCLCASVGCPC